MMDADIRGKLLKVCYDLRDSNGGQVPVTHILFAPEPVSRQAIGNAGHHLADAGYIEWGR